MKTSMMMTAKKMYNPMLSSLSSSVGLSVYNSNGVVSSVYSS